MRRPIVFLAEDHEVMALGLRGLLEDEYDVYGPHGDGNQIAALVCGVRPDLLLLDLSLLNRNGIAIIPEVREGSPDTLIIVVTIYDDYFLMEEALRRGAMGFVPKSGGAAMLLDAIAKVRGGGIYRPPGLRKPPRPELTSPHAAAIALLSPYRQEILSAIGEGLSTKVIARRMEISVATLYWHRMHIRRALGVDSEDGLARAALIWYQSRADAANSPGGQIPEDLRKELERGRRT